MQSRSDISTDDAPRQGSFISQATLSMVAEGSAALLFLSSVLMARGFGPEGYGMFSFALSFCVVLGLLLDPDFASLLSREFSARGSAARRDFASTLGLQIVMAGVFGVAVLLAWLLFRPSATSAAVIAGAGFATIFRVCKKTLRGVLRGNGHFSFQAASMVGERVALVALGVVALTGALTPATAMVAFALIRFVDLIVCSWFVNKHVASLVPSFACADLIRITRTVIPFAGVAASWLLYNHADSLMLGALLGAKAVGEYVVVYRIFEGLMVLPLALSGVLLPRMARAYHDQDPRQAEQWIERGARYLLVVSAAVVATVLVAPREILHTVYGDQYDEAAPGLCVLLAATPFVFLFAFFRAAFIAVNRTGTLAVFGLGTLLANVVANAFTIPAYGVPGACFATLGTEAVACVGSVFLLRRAGWRVPLFRPVVYALIVGLIFAVTLLETEVASGYALIGLPLAVIVAHIALCRLNFWAEKERAILARCHLVW